VAALNFFHNVTRTDGGQTKIPCPLTTERERQMFKGTVSRDGMFLKVQTFLSVLSSAGLSLTAGKIRKNKLVTGGFRYDFTESQTASCKQLSPL
jgi:hypothetical protein